MQVTDKQIIETYERIEKDGGGLCEVSPSLVLDMTAIKLDIERKIARDVMIRHWANRGAG